jgi:hypothetical protein
MDKFSHGSQRTTTLSHHVRIGHNVARQKYGDLSGTLDVHNSLPVRVIPR